MILTRFFADMRFATTRSLIAAIACAGVCGIVFGLSMPLISLRLEHMTGSGFMVGLNGAAAAFSTLVMAPIVPRLMTLLSPRLILALSLVAAAGLFILLPLFPNVWIWFGLRFAVGSFMTVVFVISETWINQVVSPERRAMMLGVYGTALAGGFGIGAILFAALHAAGDTAFYLGSLIFLAGAIPVLLLRGPDPVPPDAETASFANMIKTVGVAPAAILAGLAFGATETLVYSMMPVYGERIGLEHGTIGILMFGVALGAILLQIPVGWIADKTDRRNTLLWIAIFATIGPILAGLAGTLLPLLFLILLLQSGVVAGLYTVGLSLLGERFSGGGIAAANAAFIFAYGIGSFAGPPSAGIAMDQVGPWGLLYVLSGISAAYVLILLSRTVLSRSKS